MCGTVERLTGETDKRKAKKKAQAAEARANAERAAQQAKADAELAKQQELADAKTAFEVSKTDERKKRLTKRGGGLSTQYAGATGYTASNLGAVKDTLGG